MDGITFDFWQVIEIIILIVGLAGTYYGLKNNQNLLGAKVENVKEDVVELGKKQEKYNNLQERMVKAEQSTASAHHRLNGFEKMGEQLDNLTVKLTEHLAYYKGQQEKE